MLLSPSAPSTNPGLPSPPNAPFCIIDPWGPSPPSPDSFTQHETVMPGRLSAKLEFKLVSHPLPVKYNAPPLTMALFVQVFPVPPKYIVLVPAESAADVPTPSFNFHQAIRPLVT